MKSPDRIKIVFITGFGRSGSTVLDAILGNHPNVESVGELINATRAWNNPFEYCACGAVAGECGFWQKVRTEWDTQRPFVTTATDWPTLQIRFESRSALPRLYVEKLRHSKAFREYAAGVRALYEAIAKISGNKTIVDSSKNPVRAIALSRVKGIDLRLIHLIRDGRGAAWSLMKAYRKDPEKGLQNDLRPKPIWRTALMWRFINHLAELALRQESQNHGMRLRYEDFVVAPHEALERIGRVSGLDYSSLANALAEGKSIAVGHAIAGNRVRMGGVIRLQADMAWQENLTEAQRNIFWRIAGDKARQYGYARDA